jgi:hypothetical protein
MLFTWTHTHIQTHTHTHRHTDVIIFLNISDKLVGAAPQKQCLATEVVPCHILYCMVRIIVSRYVFGSFTIEGEVLRGDYSITVAGFNAIPPQAD